MKKYLVLLGMCGLAFSSFGQFVPLEGLPVSVQSFDLTKSGNNVQLQWKVACFIDEATFLVQRSSDGTNYITINTFTADRLRCQQPFSYTDANITDRVYYRVKVGDKDGNIFASKIVSAIGKNSGYQVNNLWPTIVQSSAVINISSATKDIAVLRVTSLTGQLSWLKNIELKPGSNETRLDLGALSKGNYVLTSTNSFGQQSAIRFVKQ